MRSRLWCFTDFKEENIREGYSLVTDIRAVAWGIETCPKTKRKHNQGFIQTFEKMSVKQIQRLLNSNCHLEVVIGSIKDNEEYCKKEGVFYTRLGEFVRQGERVDLQEFYELVKVKSDYELLEEGHAGTFIRNHNAIAKIRSILLKEKAKASHWRSLDVIILLGKAGCGKSRYVFEKSPDVFRIDCDQSFVFDGYDGEKEILIDDFNGCLKYCYMLRLLDGHPLPLNVKFGRSHAIFNKVYITTNVHPIFWYTKCRMNLKRRCPKLLLGNTNQEQPNFTEVKNFWDNKELMNEYCGEYS